MKKEYKAIMIIACITATALCTLPIMSVHLSGSESCTLYVRGYNLIEFSAWGCIPLFAPLLIIPVHCGSLTKQTKELVLLTLFVGNMVCYIHSIHAACDWIASVDGGSVTYYSGIFLMPFGFVICIVLLRFFELDVLERFSHE